MPGQLYQDPRQIVKKSRRQGVYDFEDFGIPPQLLVVSDLIQASSDGILQSLGDWLAERSSPGILKPIFARSKIGHLGLSAVTFVQLAASAASEEVSLPAQTMAAPAEPPALPLWRAQI